MEKKKKLTTKVECFDPIVDKKPRVLILGTMPGKESLKTGEYYSDPKNQFWEMIESIYNDGKSFQCYKDKLKCLKDNNIALWDVYDCCERKGSLDKEIKVAVPNDLDSFLKNNSTISVVLCNGKKVWKEFKKLKLPINFYYMPSTSGLYRSMSKEEKIEKWRVALLDGSKIQK